MSNANNPPSEQPHQNLDAEPSGSVDSDISLGLLLEDITPSLEEQLVDSLGTSNNLLDVDLTTASRELAEYDATTVNESVLSIAGIRNYLSDTHARRKLMHSRDQKFYKRSALDSIHTAGYELSSGNEIKKRVIAYDPMKAFMKTHRTKRADHVQRAPKARLVGEIDARTSLQATASLRHNLRSSRINMRELKIGKLKNAYNSYSLEDKNILKHQLDKPMHRAEKNVVKKAGREVRRLEWLNKHTLRRLKQSAHGNDIPGIFHKLR